MDTVSHPRIKGAVLQIVGAPVVRITIPNEPRSVIGDNRTTADSNTNNGQGKVNPLFVEAFRTESCSSISGVGKKQRSSGANNGREVVVENWKYRRRIAAGRDEVSLRREVKNRVADNIEGSSPGVGECLKGEVRLTRLGGRIIALTVRNEKGVGPKERRVIR